MREELAEAQADLVRARLFIREIEQALEGDLPLGYTWDNATAVGLAYRLCTKLVQAREEAEAGKDLAGWAAAIKWNHRERNTEEWLAGLRVRILKVQALAALEAGKETGG